MSLRFRGFHDESGQERLQELLSAAQQIFTRNLGFQPTVRTATRHDRERISSFIRSIRAETGIVVSERLETDLNDIEMNFNARGGFILIFERDGKILATFGFAPTTAEVAEVKKVYLEKEFRRSGLIGQVLNLVLHFARHRGIRFVEAETTHSSAYSFFTKAGFQFRCWSRDRAYSLLGADGIILRRAVWNLERH